MVCRKQLKGVEIYNFIEDLYQINTPLPQIIELAKKEYGISSDQIIKTVDAIAVMNFAGGK